jgi:hypothetical protein
VTISDEYVGGTKADVGGGRRALGGERESEEIEKRWLRCVEGFCREQDVSSASMLHLHLSTHSSQIASARSANSSFRSQREECRKQEEVAQTSCSFLESVRKLSKVGDEL